MAMNMAGKIAKLSKGTHRLQAILTALDSWYRRHARVLPWRIGPGQRDKGEAPDPYLVWLSEVMLQQTTIPHAAPYFERFAKRWPKVEKLAAAKWEDVSAAWAGLGYYSRARNLHACAKAVAERGGFPQGAAGLRELPGVGPYTANAIAAIAWDEKAAPVDGNIERVVSRLWAIESDGTDAGWRAAKAEIVGHAQALFDELPPKPGRGGQRAGDLAQALMDLGATVCTPKKPNCLICPVSKSCVALKEGAPERYPVKAAKKDRPTRHGAAFVLTRGDKVLLIRRGPSGLLGGMMMPPTSEWREAAPVELEGAPAEAAWEHIGEVRHVFTHFALKLDVWRANAGPRTKATGEWVPVEEALGALPTVGRKAVALAVRGT
jgi:A/G-specific adenine glycosylase